LLCHIVVLLRGRFRVAGNEPRLGEVRAWIERKFNSDRTKQKLWLLVNLIKKQKQNSFCG